MQVVEIVIHNNTYKISCESKKKDHLLQLANSFNKLVSSISQRTGGFGPEIFGFNDKSGTRWKLSAFPLGGYVKMLGDTNAASVPVDQQKLTEEEKLYSFHTKPRYQKAAIVFAGPFANMIFTVIAFTIFFSVAGYYRTPPVIGNVIEESAAKQAGLLPGDTITQINEYKIKYFEDISRVIMSNPETRIEIKYSRNNEEYRTILTPFTVEDRDVFANELEQVIKRHSNDIFSKLFRAIFKSGTHYSPQYLLINTELLDRFYSSKGYIQNNIQPIVEVDNNNQIELTFLIDEKQQYLFGNNEVDIETEIKDLSLREEILEFIKEENNQIFNRVKINNTAEKISKHLNEKGYIFAKVNPEYTQHNNIVDVTYKVLPGKKIYINQITIDGNDRTLDKVIRRKLSMAEGDAYNTSEIQKSRRKLIYSDFFETVKINSYIVDDNAVNLDLNVKEKRTASLSLTGGMSLPGGVFVKTDFTDRNLFGSGKEVSFALEKSQYVLSTSIDAVENNFNDSDTSLGMGVFYEKQDKPNTTFDTCNWGGIAKVSYKISENLTNSFQYSYKYNHIHMDNKGGKDEDISEIIRDQEGEYQVSSVGYTLAYNKLDNLYTPKEGYLLRLSQDISGLWGNVNFLKSEFLSFYTHPILSKIDDDITLRFKVAAGHIFSYTDEDLNIGQHFFKGGNEIRGFDLSGIGPRAEDKNQSSLGGKTYFNLTQQVDFPLSKLYDYAGIKGSLFVDYATLFGLDEKKGYSGKYYDRYQPQSTLNTKAAIIDSDKVINESLALQNIQQQIKEQNSRLQKEFENELEKFKPSKEEFDLLSEEAKKEKTEQFSKHTVSVRDNYAKKMSHLEENYREAVESVFNKIKEVAKRTAEKNNIDLVLFISKKNQVLYSMDEVDLSDVVLKNVNKEIPEFALQNIE
ncbi:jg24760 [Pararge aegeria aegeria]|uniref:Jg24760 protein n=1 Tax=Pararge aegeria aegeria TaxID=348720 RepID=A0A8S4QET7_9NEOP|nr:jg24760 [Pararge aegeria aegeria]